jgi:hypothetical protein
LGVNLQLDRFLPKEHPRDFDRNTGNWRTFNHDEGGHATYNASPSRSTLATPELALASSNIGKLGQEDWIPIELWRRLPS